MKLFEKKLADVISKDLIDLEYDSLVLMINKKMVQQLTADHHGDFNRWASAFDLAPTLSNIDLDLSKSAVTIDAICEDEKALLESLQSLIPWRKGPYQIASTYVDCEWRSDFKWDRIKQAIDLKDKRVLDIGCGNGYHCWRMLEHDPKWVLGIDPNILFNLQFRFINQFVRQGNIDVVPLGIEHLPKDMAVFDTVFSMGVLYHRKSPIDHLYELKSLLSSEGELILETLIIDGDEQAVLVPQGRYAKMRNVWFIPSVAALTLWLKKVGFKQVIVLDISVTTIDEQRSTDWMLFESLKNYLDENDSSLTIEGYPAPKRVVIKALI